MLQSNLFSLFPGTTQGSNPLSFLFISYSNMPTVSESERELYESLNDEDSLSDRLTRLKIYMKTLNTPKDTSNIEKLEVNSSLNNKLPSRCDVLYGIGYPAIVNSDNTPLYETFTLPANFGLPIDDMDIDGDRCSLRVNVAGDVLGYVDIKDKYFYGDRYDMVVTVTFKGYLELMKGLSNGPTKESAQNLPQDLKTNPLVNMCTPLLNTATAPKHYQVNSAHNINFISNRMLKCLSEGKVEYADIYSRALISRREITDLYIAPSFVPFYNHKNPSEADIFSAYLHLAIAPMLRNIALCCADKLSNIDWMSSLDICNRLNLDLLENSIDPINSMSDLDIIEDSIDPINSIFHLDLIKSLIDHIEPIEYPSLLAKLYYIKDPSLLGKFYSINSLDYAPIMAKLDNNTLLDGNLLELIEPISNEGVLINKSALDMIPSFNDYNQLYVDLNDSWGKEIEIYNIDFIKQVGAIKDGMPLHKSKKHSNNKLAKLPHHLVNKTIVKGVNSTVAISNSAVVITDFKSNSEVVISKSKSKSKVVISNSKSNLKIIINSKGDPKVNSKGNSKGNTKGNSKGNTKGNPKGNFTVNSKKVKSSLDTTLK